MLPVDKPRPERQVPLARSLDVDKPRKRKSRALSVYLEPEEEHRARREASKHNMGLSDFLRQCIRYNAASDIEHRAERIRAFVKDGQHHDALETEAWKLVEDLTGVAMPPRPKPPAPVRTLAAAPLPLPVTAALPLLTSAPGLPAPVAGTAVVPALPKLEMKPAHRAFRELMDWEREPPQPTFADTMITLLAGIWRWLLRVGTRAGERMGSESIYGRFIGRTPLQFLVTAAMLAALPVAVFGRSEVGYHLLGASDATAATILTHLPEDVQRRQQVGYVVVAMPGNVVRINACLAQQRSSKQDFWCKFRMKAGL